MLTASKGTISYGEEEGPEVLFLLKSGRVKLERVSPAGQKLTLAIVERVSFFGEMSLCPCWDKAWSGPRQSPSRTPLFAR